MTGRNLEEGKFVNWPVVFVGDLVGSGNLILEDLVNPLATHVGARTSTGMRARSKGANLR